MSDSVRQCYMCEKTASTMEHVPPKCIFPEQKDSTGGRDFRKQLITVPACDVHNTRKSRDDEYILYVLTMNLTSNQTGKNQFLTKLMRAIQRSPRLIQQFLSNHQPVTIEDTATGKRERTIAMEVDMNRFRGAMKMLSRALYFHHYGEKWLGRISVHADFLMALGSEDDVGHNELVQTMASAAGEFFKDKESQGMNKDVFKYQVFDGNENSCRMFRLHFYDETRLIVWFGLQDG